MSVNYLQGKFFLKMKDLPFLREIFEIFKTTQLEEIDQKFREIVEKKFSTNEEKRSFVKEDFNFHWEEIRKEEKECYFFQAIFLPFDYYRVECERQKSPSKSKIGYFSEIEIKKMLQNIFPPNIHFKIKELFQGQIKKKNQLSKVFLVQNEILKKFNLPILNMYLNLERKREKEFQKNFEEFFEQKIEDFDEQKEEIAKFYLPYFFKRKFFYFTTPLEFLFFYLKERFILWKILLVEEF